MVAGFGAGDSAARRRRRRQRRRILMAAAVPLWLLELAWWYRVERQQPSAVKGKVVQE